MINEVVTILYYQNSSETPKFRIDYAPHKYISPPLSLDKGNEDAHHLGLVLSAQRIGAVNLALGLESKPPLLNVFRITEERHSTLQELVEEHNGKVVIPSD